MDERLLFKLFFDRVLEIVAFAWSNEGNSVRACAKS